jgi:hypothetical protein
VEQLKIAARTSISSEDVNKMNTEWMKLVDKISFINIRNIRLMKDLHQLTEQQLNCSKTDEFTANSLLDVYTLHSMEHQ